MPANFKPRYPLTANNGWVGPVLTANTTTNLTSGTIYDAFTAGANGSFVYNIYFRTLGTNVATVARIWLNNGSTTGTATNNTLIGEVTLPATTVSQISAQPHISWTFNEEIKAGFKIYITIGTTVAAGYAVTVNGADF